MKRIINTAIIFAIICFSAITYADDLFDLSDIASSTGLPAPKYKVTVEITYNAVPYDRAKQIMEDLKKHADGCKFKFLVEKVGDDTLTFDATDHILYFTTPQTGTELENILNKEIEDHTGNPNKRPKK
jgi:hypothetical protein